MIPQSKIRLRKINNALTMIVVGLALYIIAFPFVPTVSYWWQQRATDATAYAERYGIANGEDDASAPEENRVIVPRLRLDEEIHESWTSEALDQGVWRRPFTAIPEESSNTVLAGHRFTYDGASVFYHLDKIEVDDQIIVFWEGERYEYRVRETKVVPPTAVEIEAPTESAQLTLYTCTPLWSAENRLVVIADLIESDGETQ